MTFAYDIETHMPIVADGRAVVTLIEEDGGVKTHHQQMLTPFIIANRSVFVTTYHKHSDTIDGEYAMVRSSEGNAEIADRHAERIGNDVEADLILFWCHAIPITETSCKINFIAHVNLGGGLPQKMREIIGSK